MLIRRSLVALIAVALLMTSLPGCILDPKETVEEQKKEPVEWPDRTDIEDCIEIIDLVYNREKDVEKYKEVLLKPSQDDSDPLSDGFYWWNQKEDVDEGRIEEFWGYSVEWMSTAGLLQHEQGMSLDMFPGTWESISDFRGGPCEDCWETIRSYYLDVKLDNGMNYIGDFFVKFVVGPDPDNPDRYVIYQMEDLRKGVQ